MPLLTIWGVCVHFAQLEGCIFFPLGKKQDQTVLLPGWGTTRKSNRMGTFEKKNGALEEGISCLLLRRVQIVPNV